MTRDKLLALIVGAERIVKVALKDTENSPGDIAVLSAPLVAHALSNEDGAEETADVLMNEEP